MATIEQKGMYKVFPRSGKNVSFTHYCPGCGHGIIMHAIIRALADLGKAQEKTVVSSGIPAADFDPLQPPASPPTRYALRGESSSP